MHAKILIVDDEPAIGTLLTYQLRGNDYAVQYVSDGLSALERIERERPDLVLLDVMMPTISGWEVCRQIRAYSNVPVIMLTAKSSDADIVTGLTAGADDYISKPFTMPQLQARIEAVLRRARTESRPRIALSTVGLAASQATAAQMSPVAATAPTPSLAERPPETMASDELLNDAAAAFAADEQDNRLGPRLKEARLARGIPLVQAARECNTSWEFLQAIEQENYAYVPRHQLRTSLQRYSRYVGVDMQQWVPPAKPRARNIQLLRLAIVFTLLLLVVAVGVYLM